MKFSEVPTGSKFKYEQFAFIKVDGKVPITEYNSVNVITGRFGIINSYSEVELITKCENCRFFDKNFNKDTPLDILGKGNFCHKIGITVDASEYYCLNQDPETFSCSIFETKEG